MSDKTIANFIVGFIAAFIIVGCIYIIHSRKADCHDKGGVLIQQQCVVGDFKVIK